MNKYLLIFFKIVVAVILLQTLYFKFTAHPESVYIFEKVGMEPLGRIGIGMVELVGSILLFVPGLCWLGALLCFGACSGAVFLHFTLLGIEVQGDGGTLFYMALLVVILSAILFWSSRKEVPFLNMR